MSIFPQSAFVSKREVGNIPLIGTFLQSLQCILVRLSSSKGRD